MSNQYCTRCDGLQRTTMHAVPCTRCDGTGYEPMTRSPIGANTEGVPVLPAPHDAAVFCKAADGLDRSTAQIKALREALKRLTVMARTSGGTAGPDQGLMDACEAAESALRALAEGEGAK